MFRPFSVPLQKYKSFMTKKLNRDNIFKIIKYFFFKELMMDNSLDELVKSYDLLHEDDVYENKIRRGEMKRKEFFDKLSEDALHYFYNHICRNDFQAYDAFSHDYCYAYHIDRVTFDWAEYSRLLKTSLTKPKLHFSQHAKLHTNRMKEFYEIVDLLFLK